MSPVPLPRVVGQDVRVPLVGGGTTRYVNLDYAASAPALACVREAVDAFLPWYSSVHRGAGYTSQVSTRAYEGAREAVARFLGARADDAVVFTRNTTDALNLLARCLPEATTVVTFDAEHHANLLPWRSRAVTCLPTPGSPAEVLERLASALRRAPAGPRLVAVTGASNVTGELWPVGEVVRLAHDLGARVVVDAAQLAPHAPVDLCALDADYLAASGHKLYAPFGAGVLVGRADWLASAPPALAGGGAVRFVTCSDVLWAGLPDRQEAGSPNVVGAVAMGVACDALRSAGMDVVAAHEQELLRLAEERLAEVPGLRRYSLWGPGHPRIGVLTFNLEGYEHGLLATILSAEYGIGVRHGCFCAHPFMLRLLQVGEEAADVLRARLRSGARPSLPGAVRASFGVGTTPEDVERLADALRAVAERGPAWTYRVDPAGEYVPAPDPRVAPQLPFARGEAAGGGESS